MEFPSKVTGIVGPNGSGKSNIVEALRWVLGEQSMKSLRGKKGEDLIWNGSPEVPRMGKGSVMLTFDNKDGRIPIDFEEVSIGRKIFRDGMNEYSLNDSQVRLKDVVELMARIGLGETQHNIIGQGEVDRMLLASAQDRCQMLEEALGLRVYQLKKNEAARKLVATGNNMRQVEALLREITPHLKFLREQAKKAESRVSYEVELRNLQLHYFARERGQAERERKQIEAVVVPLLHKQQEMKKEIERVSAQISEAEKQFAGIHARSEEEKKTRDFQIKRRELERELGRLEARLEIEREKIAHPVMKIVDMRFVKEEIHGFMTEIQLLLSQEDQIETVRLRLDALTKSLERLLDQIEKGTIEIKKDEAASVFVAELEKTAASLHDELAGISKTLEDFENEMRNEREQLRVAQQKIRELDGFARTKQEEERDLMLQRERLRFEEEKLEARKDILDREREAAEIALADIAGVLADDYAHLSTEELTRKIDRMRVKLEEIGGIDRVVLKEYEELEGRHSFLSKELEDLKQASESLGELIKDLERHIKKDFREGFEKIKEEFHNYFRIIFGGGRASLELVELRKESAEEVAQEENEEEEEHEPGIEISVDLPRKRIKGLAMLSGGEKALTAIALLFAITAVNPPPFLVLDETDAALDEANSQRYSSILKELSKHTQLLLVTHNRETMKAASILYGVTMGDDGVSKLLSLRLEEAEAYTNR